MGFSNLEDHYIQNEYNDKMKESIFKTNTLANLLVSESRWIIVPTFAIY